MDQCIKVPTLRFATSSFPTSNSALSGKSVRKSVVRNEIYPVYSSGEVPEQNSPALLVRR